MATGFCYVIIFLPPMGDGSFFGSDRPGWHRWAGRCVLGSWDLGWIWWKKQVAFGGFQLVISYYRSYHTLLVIFIYSIFRSSSYSSYTYIHIYIYIHTSHIYYFFQSLVVLMIPSYYCNLTPWMSIVSHPAGILRPYIVNCGMTSPKYVTLDARGLKDVGKGAEGVIWGKILQTADMNWKNYLVNMGWIWLDIVFMLSVQSQRQKFETVAASIAGSDYPVPGIF